MKQITDSMTYNKYVQTEAIKQSRPQPLTIYKVRKPLPGETVIGYSNLAEALVKPTYTESCVIQEGDWE